MNFFTVYLKLVLICVISLVIFAPEQAQALPCLTKQQHRLAIISGRAMPLARLINIVRARGMSGHVVRARICHTPYGLVYRLTVVSNNGNVRLLQFDSRNSRPIM